MKTSTRTARAAVSGTVKLADTARTMIATGHDVIELSEGEPDFDTPAHIVDAAHQAAKAGHTRYTAVAGTPALREQIVRKFELQNQIVCDLEQVVVGTGAKQLIFNALLATIDTGDEVIIPAPYWVSYPDMVKVADGTPVIVHCDSAHGLKISPEQLSNAITDRTCWLILNSPGNPSGAVYSRSELEGLAEVLRAHPDVAVLSDDIYEEIVFAGTKFSTMAEVAPDLADRILTVNGVSKSFAMTGWRIGYACGPAKLIAEMVKLQGQSTTNASSVGQAAAQAALSGPRDFLSDWLDAYTRRREIVMDRLSAVPGLALTQPAGAFYVFPDCRALLGKHSTDVGRLEDDYGVSQFLLECAGVALVPGSEFGAPGHLRLCFAKSDVELIDACDRIKDACESLA